MLQNHATIIEIRRFLQRELSKIYHEGETAYMISLIMDHCGYPSTVNYLEPDMVAGHDTIAQINEIVTEIHTHRPIQYILGETRFFEISLRVDERVFIPRPETEEMVYRIIETHEGSPSRIIDLGTGSGCIALALKKHFQHAHVSGLESSTPALELARQNGQNNSLEVEWIHGDMLDQSFPDRHGVYDLVVSNPPYVLMEERVSMKRNVLDFEPSTALFVEDNDPLQYYRAIAAITADILAPGGTLWVEINERFGTDISRLLSRSAFRKITIHKDIHDKERFIQAGK